MFFLRLKSFKDRAKFAPYANFLEIVSYIVAIVGFFIGIYQIFHKDEKLGQSNTKVTAHNLPATTKSGNVLKAGPNSQIQQNNNSGTQIQNLTINNGPIDSTPRSSETKKNPKVRIATFTIDNRNGYWVNSTDPEDGGVYGNEYIGTCLWSRLYDCLGDTEIDNKNAKCEGSDNFSPTFDISLFTDDEGSTILNGLNIFIYPESSEDQGAPPEIPKATIPLSAGYIVRLPQAIEDSTMTKVVRVGAIPPLLIKKDQPARFSVTFVPSCDVTCGYSLKLQFLFSSGLHLNTKRFRLVFAPYPWVRSELCKKL